VRTDRHEIREDIEVDGGCCRYRCRLDDLHPGRRCRPRCEAWPELLTLCNRLRPRPKAIGYSTIVIRPYATRARVSQNAVIGFSNGRLGSARPGSFVQAECVCP
jgi:hypothetical protein